MSQHKFDRRILAVQSQMDVLEASSLFGSSMAMSPSMIYVGDPGSNSVYVFELKNGSWHSSNLISGPDGVDGFGYSLALDHDKLVIGAYARVASEQGSVFVHEPSGVLRLFAASDEHHIVGFEVAAAEGNIAYSRRQRNDPQNQTGSVVVVTADGSKTTYSSEAFPDYFGVRIDLDESRLLAMAPALGAQGGSVLFGLQDGSARNLTVPVGGGRSSVEHPVVLVGGHCLMAGAGNSARTMSVLWRGCLDEQAEIVEGTGEVAASSGRLAFSDNRAFPRFGHSGPFEVFVYDFDSPKNDPFRVESPRALNSVRRNVAISETALAIAFVDSDEVAAIEVYDLN